MPSAVKYVPLTDPERQGLNAEAEKELQRRKSKYKEALRYYLGNQDEQLLNTDPNAPNDNTIINLVKLTADRTVQFLFPEPLKFETDPEQIDDTPEEIWLRKCFDANGGLRMLSKLALRGFLSGHSFIRVKPRKGKERYPSMTVLDPTTLSVYWKADDVGDVLWYEQRYMVGGDVYVQDFVHSDDGLTWKVYTYKGESQNAAMLDGYPTNNGTMYVDINRLDFTHGVFERVGKAEIHTSPIPPIIEFAHLPHPDDYYGLSEFDQKALQDTINRIASERGRIVRENSDPVDVLTGADVDDVKGDGGLLTIANKDAKVNRLEMKGDLNGITTVLDKLIETYLAIARVVLLKGEAKDLQRVTNASVRTLFLDMLAKNSLLQNTYGEALQKLGKLALMMGYAESQIESNPEQIEVRVMFGSPLPIDQTEIANINALGIAGGYMSGYTAATRLNLEPKFEQAHMDTEMEKNLENQDKQMSLAAKHAIAPEAKDKEPVKPKTKV